MSAGARDNPGRLSHANLFKAVLAQAGPVLALFAIAQILLHGQEFYERIVAVSERRGGIGLALGAAALVIWILRYSIPGMLALVEGPDLIADEHHLLVRRTRIPWRAIERVRLVSSPFRKGIAIETSNGAYFVDTILSGETPDTLAGKIRQRMPSSPAAGCPLPSA